MINFDGVGCGGLDLNILMGFKIYVKLGSWYTNFQKNDMHVCFDLNTKSKVFQTYSKVDVKLGSWGSFFKLTVPSCL